MPVERVRAMQIAGDVSIQTINVIGVRLTAAVPVFLFLCGFMCSIVKKYSVITMFSLRLSCRRFREEWEEEWEQEWEEEWE